jgi:hypothetical protein
MNPAGDEQHLFGDRSFTGVDVGNKADIPYLVYGIIFSGHILAPDDARVN